MLSLNHYQDRTYLTVNLRAVVSSKLFKFVLSLPTIFRLNSAKIRKLKRYGIKQFSIFRM